jgi:aryl-alcohol dehydrogenase-like predicted oxidoreductase
MSRIQSTNRRKFLAQTTALAVASSLPIRSFAQESMRTRAIPGTNEHLPVVGLGSPDFFYKTPEGGTNDRAKALVQAMYDGGGRIIDTPAFFRPDPPVLGSIIQELNIQDELFLIGKLTVRGREASIEHVDTTIANLGKRPLDVMLVHNIRDIENTWPVLEEAKAEGKVRYIGVSEATDRISNDVLEDFMKKGNPDFIMPSFSMYRPSIQERILPLAADMGVAVIAIEVFKTADDGAYFSLTAGKELPEWTAEFDCESWAQFGLKYVLSHPAVTCTATETSSPRHILDNLGAGHGRLPDQATRIRMRDYFLSLS